MIGGLARLQRRVDADALKALALYAGATLLLALACAHDLERVMNSSLPRLDQGAQSAVER